MGDPLGSPSWSMVRWHHRLRCRDRLTHNDVIGTAHLCMSKISAPGGELEGEEGAEGWDWDAWPWRSTACSWVMVLAWRTSQRDDPCPVTGAGGCCCVFPAWTWTLLVCGSEDVQVLAVVLGGEAAGPRCVEVLLPLCFDV